MPHPYETENAAANSSRQTLNPNQVMNEKNRYSGCERRREEPIYERIEEAEWKQRRREARQYKWKSRALMTGWILSFCLLITLIAFSDLSLTAVNVAAGLAVLNGAGWLLLRLLVRLVRKLNSQIPLKNDGYWLWRRGEPRYRKMVYDDSACPIPPKHLARIDDRQIIIDNDSTGERAFIFLLFSFLLYLFIRNYLSEEALPSIYHYGGIFIVAEAIILQVSGIVYALLTPRRRIVFDRAAKTVTIPGRLLTNKTETIPYDQAELSFCLNGGYSGSYVTISNPARRTLGAPVMPGYIDEALRLARFIHSYMEDKELPDIPEFEKYRNEGKQPQSPLY